MAELIALTVSLKAAADGDSLRLRLPVAATLVGVSVAGEDPTGAPTGGFVSLVEEVLDEFVVVPLTDWHGDWRSRHFGGAAAPVALPAGTSVGVRLYLSGGATPTLNCTASLWFVL